MYWSETSSDRFFFHHTLLDLFAGAGGSLAVTLQDSKYFQSILLLTASAVCRSVSPSTYCKIVTKANRNGDAPGCPWLENNALKSRSHRKGRIRSAIAIQRLPLGKSLWQLWRSLLAQHIQFVDAMTSISDLPTSIRKQILGG
jgi:hypothetical protein